MPKFVTVITITAMGSAPILHFLLFDADTLASSQAHNIQCIVTLRLFLNHAAVSVLYESPPLGQVNTPVYVRTYVCVEHRVMWNMCVCGVQGDVEYVCVEHRVMRNMCVWNTG